ncbi:hypothetical protein F511_27648 [Dorcoceras hygrometricum]|uniref:Uncharacterized protein n=1 Tax=Dorcoceras hygrometricum TaxID=472368 RepID=A0A2Z7CX25_9LAMI|nr:hypothetical protein F511_27648 [Dorcoceras hygrometricum]
MGIDQLKLRSVQPGYLKNLPEPIQTKAAQNRCDDSADHHKAVWYSGTTTQLATTSKIALDLSGTTTQPADHNLQRNSTSKRIGLNMEQQPTQVYCPSSFTANTTEATTSSNMLRYLNINSNPKLLKNGRTTGPQSQRHTNTASTSRSSNPATQVSKLVSIESLREDELSATSLAPKGDEK